MPFTSVESVVESLVEQRAIRKTREWFVGGKGDGAIELPRAIALQQREQHQERYEQQQADGGSGGDERDHVPGWEQQQVDQVREPECRRQALGREPEPVAVQEPRGRGVERELRAAREEVHGPVAQLRSGHPGDEEHDRRPDRMDRGPDDHLQPVVTAAIAHAADRGRRERPRNDNDRYELNRQEEQRRDEYRMFCLLRSQPAANSSKLTRLLTTRSPRRIFASTS